MKLQSKQKIVALLEGVVGLSVTRGKERKGKHININDTIPSPNERLNFA